MRFYLLRCLAVLLFLGILPHALWALPMDPRGAALGLVYGPFLVDELPRVDEVLPLSGVRYAHPILRSQIEYGAMMAKAKGISYERYHFTFRNPIGGGPIVAHWLFGLHLDHYTSRATPFRSSTTKWASGWHVGAGWRAALTEQLTFRNDYIWGKSPGSQLHIQVGLEYFFSFSGSP